MSEGAHEATISRWSRKRERIEDEEKQAKKSMKESLAEAMREASTKRNIRGQVSDALKSGESIRSQANYVNDGEIITGLEKRYWERD